MKGKHFMLCISDMNASILLIRLISLQKTRQRILKETMPCAPYKHTKCHKFLDKKEPILLIINNIKKKMMKKKKNGICQSVTPCIKDEVTRD